MENLHRETTEKLRSLCESATISVDECDMDRYLQALDHSLQESSKHREYQDDQILDYAHQVSNL